MFINCKLVTIFVDISFLRYVHYEVEGPTVQFVKEAGSNKVESVEVKALGRTQQDMTILYPPQWVQCDLRYLDMTVLGQCTTS
jgi:mRNA (2'-O-methyladenosine-N6-)-methyltransferase